MTTSLKGWVRVALGIIAAGVMQAGAAPLPATTSMFDISWQGAGGYSLTGRFSYAASLDSTPRVTGSQLDDLSIVALLQGKQVGAWDLRNDGVALPSVLNFNFDPVHRSLATGGAANGAQGQLWNTTNGGATCASPGVGFASGSSLQLLCLNGRSIGESSIPVGNSTLRVAAVLPDGPPAGVPEPAPLLLLAIPLFALGFLKSVRPSAANC